MTYAGLHSFPRPCAHRFSCRATATASRGDANKPAATSARCALAAEGLRIAACKEPPPRASTCCLQQQLIQRLLGSALRQVPERRKEARAHDGHLRKGVRTRVRDSHSAPWPGSRAMHHLAAGRAVQRSHSAGIFFRWISAPEFPASKRPAGIASRKGQQRREIFCARQARTGHRVREGRERSAHTKSRASPGICLRNLKSSPLIRKAHRFFSKTR